MTGRATPFQRTLRSGKKLIGLDGGDPPAIPLEPDPSPTPIPGREEEEAKKKVRKRAGKGRQQNILAGRLMASRNNTNILNTRLG